MRAWTLEDEVKLMVLWRDRSLSIAEIGRRLHRHPSSVQWKVRELKIPRDRNYIKPPPEPEKPLPDSGYGYRGELKAGTLL